MKKRVLFIGLVLTIFLLALSCSSKDEVEAVNVVDDVAPLSTMMEYSYPMLDQLVSMPVDSIDEFLRSTLPHLSSDIVFYLRQEHVLKDECIDSVVFLYGSLEGGVSALDAQFRSRHGYFENELIASVFSSKFVNPHNVFVKGLCRVLTFPPTALATLRYIGVDIPPEEFTIQKGKGLIEYVSYQIAIDLAQRHGLELYRGGGREPQKITPDEARGLESSTDQEQVMILVYPGAYFNLRTGEYRPGRGPKPRFAV
ncbi:MAG: hypothetical protein WC289_00575 [Patescibacteria group bacterium]|jgi:hypothetical protein